MLILTRRIGEKMMIGEDTHITVLGIKDNQVRFAIEAPMDVPVHREEIFLKVKAEQSRQKMMNANLDISLTDTFLANKKTAKFTHH